MLVADHCTVFGLLLHLLPLGRAALHLITVGGSCAHLESLWLVSCRGIAQPSCCKLSELARQLGLLGGRVFDGLHGAVVRDPDGPGLESGSSRSARTDALVSEQAVFIDRCALTEMPVDKIIIERHPSKIDKDGRHHYLIRAIPYRDPRQEAERLKAVHEARVKIVPRV